MCLVVAVSFSGCSSPSQFRPLTETRVTLNQPGRIGVVAFSSASEINVVMPVNKQEATRAASASIRFMTTADFKSWAPGTGGDPLYAAILLTLPVTFPIISAVTGSVNLAQSWVRAENESQLAPSRDILQNAVAGVRLETRERDRILAALQAETNQPFTVIDDATLRAVDPTLGERAWHNAAGLNAKARTALARRGLDRVLEIRVHAPALIARSSFDQHLALNTQVRVRLVSLPDGKELYCRDANFFGAPRPYSEWSAGGAALVHAEIEHCIETTSRIGMEGLLPTTTQAPGFAGQVATMSR